MEIEQSKCILNAVREVRRLHRDIALLLRTCDDFMGERGWTGYRDNTSTYAEGSTALGKPHKWMPRVLFRVYYHNLRPHVFAFISVILDDDKNVAAFTTPLISAGVINYGMENSAIDFDWHYLKVANWHGNDKEQFSTPVTVSGSEIVPNQHNAKSINYIHHPLARIQGNEQLSTLIFSPLESMLEKHEATDAQR